MDTGSARGAERPLKGFVLCMHVEREGGLPTLSIQGYLPLCLAAEPDSRALQYRAAHKAPVGCSLVERERGVQVALEPVLLK